VSENRSIFDEVETSKNGANFLGHPVYAVTTVAF